MTTEYSKLPINWLGANSDAMAGIVLSPAALAAATQTGDITTASGGLLLPAASKAALTADGWLRIPVASIAGLLLSGDSPAVANGDVYLTPAQVAAFTGALVVSLPELPEVTAAEAAGSTGDFANILYGILHETYEKFRALTVTKPVNWVIYKGETLSATVEGESVVSFNVQFTTVTPAGQKNVKAEA